VPQRQGIVAQGTPRPTLNARAEELKAQLLKSKERAKSGTPPVSTAVIGSKPSNTTDVAKLFRESPKTPGPSSDEPPALSGRTPANLDDDLDDLIFQAQAAAHVKKERTQNGSAPTKPQHSPMLESTIKSQIHNVESSAKLSMPGTNGTSSHTKLARQIISKKESNGDLSDVSEGEIQEDLRTRNKILQPSTGPKETQNTTRPYKHDEQVLRKPDEQNRKATYSHETRGTSPYKDVSVPKSRVTAPRLFDERHEDAEERFDRRSRQPSDKYERKHQPEPDQRSYLHRDIRDVSENQRKHETKHDGSKEDVPSRKQEVPTLAQLLLVDEDLKDWLDVTGYHNAEYRNKILNRRRAIAALDAQKAKLLEEMEIEERGGVPPVINTQVSTAGMLPPPIPSKMGAAASSVKKIDDVPVRTENERLSSTTSNPDSSAKRTYTDYRGSQNEGDVEKVGRPEDRGRGMGIKIKSDTQAEDHRPYSSGPDASRRRSTSDDNKTFRRDERDSYDEDRGRDRGRAYDRQRNYSPPEEGYDRSAPAKVRKYEFSSAEERDDRSDWKNRPFVMRGNYRGRAYDPNYRGRGRGRGSWNELGEGRFDRRDSQPSQPFAQRLAFMKPYRDPKPLDLGRRGGQ
jgi:YTH domain-containing protein 1